MLGTWSAAYSKASTEVPSSRTVEESEESTRVPRPHQDPQMAGSLPCLWLSPLWALLRLLILVSLNIIFLFLITIVCAYALVWRGQHSWNNVSPATVYVLPSLLGKRLYPLRHFASSSSCVVHSSIQPLSMSLSKRHDGQMGRRTTLRLSQGGS